MNVNSRMPPDITGDTEMDVKRLNNWCGVLLNKLKNTLSNIEDNNIKSVSADKISGGSININASNIIGANTRISSDSIGFIFVSEDTEIACLELSVKDNDLYFLLTTPDNKHSIKIENGNLYIKANSVNADEINAENINATHIVSTSLNSNSITCDTIQAREYINRG